jgi:hypothetical protein
MRGLVLTSITADSVCVCESVCDVYQNRQYLPLQQVRGVLSLLLLPSEVENAGERASTHTHTPHTHTPPTHTHTHRLHL